MAELFDKDSDTVGLHLKNIYQDGELDEAATTEDSSVVRHEGKRQVRRTIKHYNLGRHHLRRLPRQFQKGHAVSYLGDRAIA